MRGALVLVATGVAALWILALVSMNAGNPTAINAVLGIPFGALFGGALLYIVTRRD